MNLSDLSLLQLQSAHMQRDPTTQAMCAVLDPHFRQLADEVKLVLIWGRVDYLDAAVLDELAWSMSVDWYDVTASVEVKRVVIKTALKTYRAMGTPGAVEEVVRAYFGSSARVMEWFEYGGNPFKFKVLTGDGQVTGVLTERFTRAVNRVKNVRSLLESIIISRTKDLDLYFGSVQHMARRVSIIYEAAQSWERIVDTLTYTISNPGTESAAPVITITALPGMRGDIELTGAFNPASINDVITNPVLTIGSQVIQFTGSIPRSGRLVLNCAAGTATLNGATVGGQITGNYPRLQPGNNVLGMTDTTSTSGGKVRLDFMGRWV